MGGSAVFGELHWERCYPALPFVCADAVACSLGLLKHRKRGENLAYGGVSLQKSINWGDFALFSLALGLRAC